MGFIESLRERLFLENLAKRQGWFDGGGFVLGQEIYMPDGRVLGVPNIKTDFKYIGSSELWANTTECLNCAELAPEAFTILLAFASPLIKLSGMSGVIAMPYGNPRCGKTLICQLMMSAWSDPTMICTAYGADFHERFRTYDRHGSLPVFMEGFGNFERPADLIKIANDFCLGEAKRYEPGAETGRLSNWKWSSILVMTAFGDVLSRRLHANSMPHYQMFSYEVGKSNGFIKRAPEIHQLMMSNYGCAGRAFVEFIVRNSHTIKPAIELWAGSIRKGMRDYEGLENLIFMLACVFVAGEITEKLSLIKFDPRHSIEFSLKRLRVISKMMNKRRATA